MRAPSENSLFCAWRIYMTNYSKRAESGARLLDMMFELNMDIPRSPMMDLWLIERSINTEIRKMNEILSNEYAMRYNV
jgi:hypothetical protein